MITEIETEEQQEQNTIEQLQGKISQLEQSIEDLRRNIYVINNNVLRTQHLVESMKRFR